MRAKTIWNASCVRTLKLKRLINRSRVYRRKRPATPPGARSATRLWCARRYANCGAGDQSSDYYKTSVFPSERFERARPSPSSPCSRWPRGLGANAAIFSVVDAVLLRSLPFRNADRLVEVWEDASHFGLTLAPLAPANAMDWKGRNHVFEDMAALKGDLYALTGAGSPEQVEGSPVTANL